MPEMDGQQALKEIRALEEAQGIRFPKGAKIIMTTAVSDFKNLTGAFHSLCDAYLVKPIRGEALYAELKNLKLI